MLRHVEDTVIIALMMVAVSFCETSVSLYQRARHIIPENNRLHLRHYYCSHFWDCNSNGCKNAGLPTVRIRRRRWTSKRGVGRSDLCDVFLASKVPCRYRLSIRDTASCGNSTLPGSKLPPLERSASSQGQQTAGAFVLTFLPSSWRFGQNVKPLLVCSSGKQSSRVAFSLIPGTKRFWSVQLN